MSKNILIQFEDGVDTSAFTMGKVVSLTDGITTISNGKVVTQFPLENPTPTLVPHTHPASTNVGSAIPPATP